jgi:hypothetical protein
MFPIIPGIGTIFLDVCPKGTTSSATLDAKFREVNFNGIRTSWYGYWYC